MAHTIETIAKPVTVSVEQLFQLAAESFRAQAAYLGSPMFSAVIVEAAATGMFAQGLDLLSVRLASLVATGGANDHAAALLKFNADRGIIKRYGSGSPLYSRTEIQQALKDGKFLQRPA